MEYRIEIHLDKDLQRWRIERWRIHSGSQWQILPLLLLWWTGGKKAGDDWVWDDGFQGEHSNLYVTSNTQTELGDKSKQNDRQTQTDMNNTDGQLKSTILEKSAKIIFACLFGK